MTPYTVSNDSPYADLRKYVSSVSRFHNSTGMYLYENKGDFLSHAPAREELKSTYATYVLTQNLTPHHLYGNC